MELEGRGSGVSQGRGPGGEARSQLAYWPPQDFGLDSEGDGSHHGSELRGVCEEAQVGMRTEAEPQGA